MKDIHLLKYRFHSELQINCRGMNGQGRSRKTVATQAKDVEA